MRPARLILLCSVWLIPLAAGLGAAVHQPMEQRRLMNDIAAPWPDVHLRKSAELRGNARASTPVLPENQARCLGPQALLVIRVDFSDAPGEPITITQAKSVLDNEVKPFMEHASYGKTTIVSTVSAKVYRMPLSAEVYAQGEPADNYGAMNRELFDAAEEAAKADYALEDYSRIIVSISSQLSERFPAPKWNLRGLASISDRRLWIGEFSFDVVTHELCHTYGAFHSNLWVGTSADPVAYNGVEGYGDTSDMMGHAMTPDRDLAPWHKYLCGWLPDEAVKSVTSSGTYRVYRFDTPDADLSRHLALRFSRDGIRYYWVSLRGGVIPSANNALAGMANGAYVGLALHGNDDFNTVDLAQPYNDPKEVVLAVDSTFADPAAGLSIRVAGKGGTGKDSYLDIEITLNPLVTPSLVAWGKASGFERLDGPQPPVKALEVAAGVFHSVVLRPDRTVWAGPDYPSPITTVPTTVKDVVSIAAGHDVSAAVSREGALTVWGGENYGLGSPPAGLKDVRAVAFGQRHALALRGDGTVVSWGTKDNAFSQYPGAGDFPKDLRNVVAIATGDYHSVALRRDGSIVAAGWQTESARRDITDFTAIACSAFCALGLRANGTTVVLFNASGDRENQIPVGLSDVKAIAGGRTNFFALQADGTAIGWGGNALGTNSFHNLIVTPPPGVRMRSISGGAFHSLGALETVGSPVISQAPARANGKVTISWHPGAGASRYLLEVSPLPTFATFLPGWEKLDVGDVTSAVITTLDPSATYYCRVHSVSAAGDTSFSNIGIITPADSVAVSVPQNQAPNAGATATLAVTVPTGASCQWQRNGNSVAGGSATTLTLVNVQPADAGLYVAETVKGAAQSVSDPAIMGLLSDRKVLGSGEELLPVDVPHPNGNIFDQVLLTGTAESITADYAQNQITRTSFVDLDGDIVQVEFSGPGTLSLVLDHPSGRAVAENYNQPSVQYMKGHASIVITGATEQTNVSVFTVGRATAVNQALFKDSVTYDGIADIAFIAVSSTNGRFGGIRAANAQFFASKGFTGVYAPGVEFTGPVYLSDISAYDTARPGIILGSANDVRITGGDMLQDNGQPVRVSGITQLKFTAGSDSHGHTLSARPNDAVYTKAGADVTAQIVFGP